MQQVDEIEKGFESQWRGGEVNLRQLDVCERIECCERISCFHINNSSMYKYNTSIFLSR